MFFPFSKGLARMLETRSLLETDMLSACERILYEIQDHEDGTSPVTLLYHEILSQVRLRCFDIRCFDIPFFDRALLLAVLCC